jgi:hypothetical protein
VNVPRTCLQVLNASVFVVVAAAAVLGIELRASQMQASFLPLNLPFNLVLNQGLTKCI